MKKEIIILMGGQGVGKGTFARVLRAAREFNHIETGALFRALPADSDIAKLIAGGNLVPDEKLFELIESKINNDTDNLIDGFPRTLPQAKWLVENYADKFNIKVIFLNVPEEIMLQRIHKRLSVDKRGRADDADPSAVRKRIDAFWNVTMPTIEWLRTADGISFTDFDATGTCEADNCKQIIDIANS